MIERFGAAQRIRVVVELDEASRLIAPLWPIGTFIALNPLWDLRQHGFDAAIEIAHERLGAEGLPSSALLASEYQRGRITDEDLELACSRRLRHARPTAPSAAPDSRVNTYDQPARTESVNREVAKWCARFLSDGGAGSGASLYDFWRARVVHDPGARRLLGRRARRLLSILPDRPEDAILSALQLLGHTEAHWREEFERQLAALAGYAGLAKWQSRWAPRDRPPVAFTLVDFVAIRLSYDARLRRGAPRDDAAPGPREDTTAGAERCEQDAGSTELAGLCGALAPLLDPLGPREQRRLFLEAYESHYRDQLLDSLERIGEATERTPPSVQLLFCIDARSEGLRRHLEAIGRYETFGVAGFFGIPQRFHPLASEPVDLCPVLVSPTVEFVERPAEGEERRAQRHVRGRTFEASADASFQHAREGSLSPYLLAEAAGLIGAPLLLAKTLDPARFGRARRWLHRRLAPPSASVVNAAGAPGGSDEQQLFMAETMLLTIGLTAAFAPLVVLVAHGSTTENNPHASALDCGACGGNRGAGSARAAAAILNRPEIRERLAHRGIDIDGGTWFLAAEHDTATDEVRLLDTHLVPSAQRDTLARLADDLAEARERLASERSRALPGAGVGAGARAVERRSADWAEVRPEWGLAKNAAFVVGRRSMSVGVDLERRAFLHSYDATLDPDGEALENILTAPMVVAHWINAQYYFSTVDPCRFGAGDKTVHNVVAGIAVTEGTAPDLKLGLPIQSVFAEGAHFHEPLRLQVVIEAPLELVERVIGRNPVLRELFDGEWVHLAARPGRGEAFSIRYAGGHWTTWEPAGRARGRDATGVGHIGGDRHLRGAPRHSGHRRSGHG